MVDQTLATRLRICWLFFDDVRYCESVSHTTADLMKVAAAISYYQCESDMLHKAFASIRIRLIRMLCARHRVVCADAPRVAGFVPKLRNEGECVIGKATYFYSYRTRQSITVRRGATLRIGNHAFINDGVDICANVGITIGNHVKIAPMAAIYHSNYRKVSPGEDVRKMPIVIGDNVWIGVNAVVLPGASIGDHAVIAAGSIVTGVIPRPWSRADVLPKF
jgi:acetyltransferase-like isoleucine patch superfamily enzyme